MTRAAAALSGLLFATSVVACDGDSKKAADAKPAAEDSKVDAKPAEKVADEPGAVLTLGVAKLFEKDKPSEALELSADGKVSMQGTALGTFSADGTLTLTDGTVALEAKPDGSVLAKGKPTELKLTDTGGVLSAGGESASIGFNPDGTMALDPPPDAGDPEMGHEGCAGPMAKTCALAMFAMLSVQPVPDEIGPSDTAPPEPEPAPAPPPVPAPQ